MKRTLTLILSLLLLTSLAAPASAALAVKTGVFSTGTAAAGNTITVAHGLGTTPKIVKLWATGRADATDAVSETAAWIGTGVGLSTSSRLAFGGHAQLGGTSASGIGHTPDGAFSTISTGNVEDGRLDVDSMDATNFVLIVDDQMPRDTRVSWIALGGDDLSNVEIASFVEPAATGSVDYAGLFSFQPEFLIFVGDGQDAATSDYGSSMAFMMGLVDSAMNQAVCAYVNITAQGSGTTRGYGKSGECVAFCKNPSLGSRANLTAFLATGFTLNWSAADNFGRRIWVVGGRGPRCQVGSFSSSTSTGNLTAQTGLGTSPRGGLVMSAGRVASTAGTQTNDATFSLGYFDSASSRSAQGYHDLNGNTNMDVTTAIEFDAVAVIPTVNGNVRALVDVASIDADGFTPAQDDADTVASFNAYMIFGDAPAAGGGGFNAKRFSGSQLPF